MNHIICNSTHNFSTVGKNQIITPPLKKMGCKQKSRCQTHVFVWHRLFSNKGGINCKLTPFQIFEQAMRRR